MAEPTETDETEEVEDENPNVRQMRKKLEALEKENVQLRRDSAFAAAGVDLDSPAGKMFVKAYEGKLDAEAIKAEAETIPGVLKTAEVVTEPVVTTATEDEQAQTRERQALATGAEVDAGISEDGRTAARKVMDAVRAEGGTEERILGAGFASLVGAAHAGDRSVIVPNNRVAREG